MTVYTHHLKSRKQGGFSLVEVVLAIGIFLVTVLALVGLLGPTLKSIDQVEKTDEVSSIVNTVNSFLYSSPSIALASETKFETIYKAVTSGGFAQLYVFRAYRDGTSTDIVLRVGFNGSEPTNTNAQIDVNDFVDAAGPIYRVVLTPSSTIPLNYHSSTTTNSEGDVIPARNSSTGSYQLNGAYADYIEGYFAMEVRIYAEDPGPNFNADNLPPDYSTASSLTNLKDLKPIFTYNTAIVR